MIKGPVLDEFKTKVDGEAVITEVTTDPEPDHTIKTEMTEFFKQAVSENEKKDTSDLVVSGWPSEWAQYPGNYAAALSDSNKKWETLMAATQDRGRTFHWEIFAREGNAIKIAYEVGMKLPRGC